MKILPIDKVREGDAFTIKNEPIESINLMERAATTCSDWIAKNIKNDKKIIIFCGLGNNGGDGMAIARLLCEKDYNCKVYKIIHSDKCSDDFKINYERLKTIYDIQCSISDLKEGDTLPSIDDKDVIIDAIFGSGLSKPVKGFVAEIISHINNSQATIISIDVPTGLFCDESSNGRSEDASPNTINNAIIEAKYTLTFQQPKFAFMYAENYKYVGEWTALDIGISQEYTDNIEVKNYYTLSADIKSIYKPRKKFAHKGNYGHGLLISGSYGKIGAAVLGSKASLRTGIGLQTTHIPGCGYQILQTAVPEAMVNIDKSETIFTELTDISKYNAIAIGPGIGMENQTQQALKSLLQKVDIPLIIDADAINILGENKDWLSFLQVKSILTPHLKEFERITEKAQNDFHRNKIQREFSIRYGVYVVLKGAQTAISTPEGKCYFNSTGNPGMATAGSGDVLTGMILSLVAQNYSPFEACILGVYIHGLAGDIAAEARGYEALIAGDIIENIGNAFKRINKG